jgi:NADH-quinone oxidoreductase subunit H
MTIHLFFLQLLGVLGLLAFMGFNGLFMDWWERKLIGHIHVRPGPMHTGWHGALQPLADVVKMLSKEDIVPDRADRLFFWMGPVIAIVPAFLAMAVLPLAPGFALADIGHGLFFVFAMQTIMPFGYTMIGWSGHNKWSLVGSLRSAAQLISYEIPMLIAALGVVMLAGTARLTDIVEKQATIWYAFKQPIGFAVFFITALAEMNRTPFDMPEAESELVAGIHTEYSGMKWGLVMIAEYTAMLVGSLMIVLLYLGGWNAPFMAATPAWLGALTIVVKLFLVQSFIVWIRGTYPRMRMDRTMEMGWKYLIPIALGNLVLVGVLAMVFPKF